jgi:hypothetical protein
MDSRRLGHILRAILRGDFEFEAPSHRTSTRVALFLAGMGAGVLVGVLFAPASSAGRARVNNQESGTDVSLRPKEPSGEPTVKGMRERSAS